MICTTCGRLLKYLGSTRDGEHVTDYFVCIKGHEKKMDIRYWQGIERVVDWLEEAPF